MREPTPDTRELLQGTLDMLVLKSLQLGPMHGWGITAHRVRFAQRAGPEPGIALPRPVSPGETGIPALGGGT